MEDESRVKMVLAKNTRTRSFELKRVLNVMFELQNYQFPVLGLQKYLNLKSWRSIASYNKFKTCFSCNAAAALAILQKLIVYSNP